MLLYLTPPSPTGLAIWSICNTLSLSWIHCTEDAYSSGTPQAHLEPVRLWNTWYFMHHRTVMNVTQTMMGSLNKLHKTVWGKGESSKSGNEQFRAHVTHLENAFLCVPCLTYSSHSNQQLMRINQLQCSDLIKVLFLTSVWHHWHELNSCVCVGRYTSWKRNETEYTT